MNIAEAAAAWLADGVSTIPIRPDGTKRPQFSWEEYQRRLPTEDELHRWFGPNRTVGLALICGGVSAGLEMLELEGRAMTQLDQIESIIMLHGLTDLWESLLCGYAEFSPTGGLHLLYRINDHDVPGNKKIARTVSREVLAETRGEGGYVIVAPTGGNCHPSGKPWVRRNGISGKIPLITWEQRCALHFAIEEAINEETPAPAPARVTTLARTGLSPGDDFEDQVDWADELLLGGAGWKMVSRTGGARSWVRPGKDPQNGISATTGRATDRDRLYVFSTSTEFETEVPYTKFGAYALLHHGGNHSAAARELARIGFGEQRLVKQDNDSYITKPGVEAEVVEKDDQPFYTHDDVGNAERLWDRVKDGYRFVSEEKRGYVYDGRVWREDFDGELVRDMIKVTDGMKAEAAATGNEALSKWAKKSRSRAAIDGACKLMASIAPGATIKYSSFNPDRHLLNVNNGVLNLETRELLPHSAKFMMSRMFAANYDPNATCPNFEKFISQAMPDEEMRRYIQRALGYSLLGDADQRAIFITHGPSGTGKSTLMEVMRSLFGDYGTTAPTAAFMPRSPGSPLNDLHDLRGKRFVSTSETSKSVAFDESLLKRLAGRDRVKTRDLYERNQEWTPECALWLATNNPPEFSSDDDAIWRRAKLIPFEVVFDGTADEIKDMARKQLLPELDGIFNWLLAGLDEYLRIGIAEPECVRAAAQKQRSTTNSGIGFVEDQIAEGTVVKDEVGTVRTQRLYSMYVEWCRREGYRPLGSRRLKHQLESQGLKYDRTGGSSVWIGIRVADGVSALGTFMIE